MSDKFLSKEKRNIKEEDSKVFSIRSNATKMSPFYSWSHLFENSNNL